MGITCPSTGTKFFLQIMETPGVSDYWVGKVLSCTAKDKIMSFEIKFSYVTSSVLTFYRGVAYR